MKFILTIELGDQCSYASLLKYLRDNVQAIAANAQLMGGVAIPAMGGDRGRSPSRWEIVDDAQPTIAELRQRYEEIRDRVLDANPAAPMGREERLARNAYETAVAELGKGTAFS